jgi:hypothetical protein
MDISSKVVSSTAISETSISNAFLDGHVHDGGDTVTIKINGKAVCESKSLYGGPGHEQVQEDGKVWKTISKNTQCGTAIPVRRGDEISFEGTFDFEAHPG